MKALAFDLGDTLVEYEGLPPSWVDHYPDALAALGRSIGLPLSAKQTESCVAILNTYNTRLTPREVEVGFSEILQKILACLKFNGTPDEIACAKAFFSVFRGRLRAFPDSLPALRRLSQQNFRIGVFTDVPYGMPRALVEEDIQLSGLSDLLGVVVTSGDAGFRKPRPETLQALANRLECVPSGMAYIGNERKDVEAALAFGCKAVLLDRLQQNPDWGQHRTIHSLAELQ